MRGFLVRLAVCARAAAAAILIVSGSGAAAQDVSPERTEYRLYVANESSDIVSRVVFRPGVGVEVEKEIPVGIMPADNDGAHGLTVSPDGDFWYRSVSTPCPSNRTCGFPASGSQSGSRLRPR